MAANDPKPTETAPDTAKEDAEAVERESSDHAAKERPAIPRLAAYYSDSKVKPAAFFKAVREAKIGSFAAEDIAETLQRLGQLDPTLDRTVALLNKGLDPVARWVVDATKASLAFYLPGVKSDEHEPANTLFDRVMQGAVEGLVAKDRRRRTRTQNLLRLVLVLFLGQRNLSPIDALLSIRKASATKGGSAASNLKREAIRLLARSKIGQLQDLSLVALLFDSFVMEATRERQEVFSSLAGLQDRIAALELKLKSAQSEIDKAREDYARQSSELAALQNDLHNERQLRTLERSKQAGRSRSFLAERLRQPLSDARDALDFEPPHMDAVRQRIEMAISAIDSEIGKSNE